MIQKQDECSYYTFQKVWQETAKRTYLALQEQEEKKINGKQEEDQET